MRQTKAYLGDTFMLHKSISRRCLHATQMHVSEITTCCKMHAQGQMRASKEESSIK